MAFQYRLQYLLAASALALTACGGGSVSGGGAAASASTVSGTAATGAAIAAGSVTLKCVSGTTTAATTGTDGSFTIDISGVTLPCVGRVDYKDATGAAQKLHTFISAKGTANITPVTELLVANLTGGTALAAFDAFDATKAKAITAAQVTAAAKAVKDYLKNTLGVDTANLPDDPVGAKFVPKNGAVAGDAFDKVLDDIQAKLKAGGKTLANVVTDLGKPAAVAAGSFTITLASNAARNGVYTPAVFVYPGATAAEISLNGATKDGNFEVELDIKSGAITGAHFWFFESGKIKFFGCDNKAVVCPANAVGFEPILKQIIFNKAALSEVTALDFKSPDVLVPGGETLTIDGQVNGTPTK